MNTRIRQKAARSPKLTIAQRLQSSAATYGAYCGFVALIFFIAGGSRGDILSLAIARPAAILFAGYALICGARPSARLGPPFWLLVALMLLMAIQLVPVPYFIWAALPGRELVADNDRAIGLGEIWRTLSLSPNRTWNSLFSLGIPLAALLLLAAQWPLRPRRLLWPILLLAGISAVLGLLQTLGPNGGPLYFYSITNADSAVGLFSNRNHHAIFLASLFPLSAYAALGSEARGSRRMLVIAGCLGGMLFAMLLILATGSRSGALLSIVSVVLTAVLVGSHIVVADHGKKQGHRRTMRVAIGAVSAVLVSALMLIYLAQNSAAFERLFTEQLDGELRVRLLPHLWHMVEAYFPAGSGFGTFELAYKTMEPLELLQPRYLNQAHNDLVQFLIEGGLAGVGLLLAFLIWFGVSGWRSAHRFLTRPAGQASTVEVAPFAWASMAILLAGSVGDYPLRTPSLMLYAAVLCALIVRPKPAASAGQRRAAAGPSEAPSY